MIQRDDEAFEAELARLTPSRPPQELLSRLVSARPSCAPEISRPRPVLRLRDRLLGPWQGFRWWIASAATAAALIMVVASLSWPRPGGHSIPKAATSVALTPVSNHDRGGLAKTEVLNADDVEIERSLLADFDAVAELPDGVPVRFSCREWEDRVTFRDSNRGVMVERSVPRFEIVPVKFETY